jgi:hypothetical protein
MKMQIQIYETLASSKVICHRLLGIKKVLSTYEFGFCHSERSEESLFVEQQRKDGGL